MWDSRIKTPNEYLRIVETSLTGFNTNADILRLIKENEDDKPEVEDKLELMTNINLIKIMLIKEALSEGHTIERFGDCRDVNSLAARPVDCIQITYIMDTPFKINHDPRRREKYGIPEDKNKMICRILNHDILWFAPVYLIEGDKQYQLHFSFHNPGPNNLVSSMSFRPGDKHTRLHFSYSRTKNIIRMNPITPYNNILDNTQKIIGRRDNRDSVFYKDIDMRENAKLFGNFVQQELNRLHTASLEYLGFRNKYIHPFDTMEHKHVRELKQRELDTQLVEFRKEEIRKEDAIKLAKEEEKRAKEREQRKKDEEAAKERRKKAEEEWKTKEPTDAWIKYQKYKTKYLELKAKLKNMK